METLANVDIAGVMREIADLDKSAQRTAELESLRCGPNCAWCDAHPFEAHRVKEPNMAHPNNPVQQLYFDIYTEILRAVACAALGTAEIEPSQTMLEEFENWIYLVRTNNLAAI
jgi:hypothetical protein